MPLACTPPTATWTFRFAALSTSPVKSGARRSEASPVASAMRASTDLGANEQ